MPIQWNGNSSGKGMILMNSLFRNFFILSNKKLFQLDFHFKLTFISNVYTRDVRSSRDPVWLVKSWDCKFCSPEEEIFQSPHKFLQEGGDFLPETFHVAICISQVLWDHQAEGTTARPAAAAASIWMPLPCCPPCSRFFPFPLWSPQIKARRGLHRRALLWICSQEPSPITIRLSASPTSPCLPPPPSLTKGKKELEPQLEIYHAIVYHEFLVNHIGEAGLFISETLNQYKVGLLVLKLGWSVKKWAHCTLKTLGKGDDSYIIPFTRH